ncbi:MAG TPA: DUF3224 domain-containing protein [Acidimicrobiales bacterium]|jgi:hypothetical protein|nr:DUF3224 domain-containing protein [Acidimicrobiales bacterium]
MHAHMEATFDVEKWDESPFDDQSDAPRLTRAVVIKQYSGDVEGSSITEWLMAYSEDGSAEFVGLERISGSINGRVGSLVLRHVGAYEDGAAKGDLDVVEGGGSGALRSASGDGQFSADPGGSVQLDLAFD